ncbi:MAG: sugar transferase, partial [Novosphingobium sp.]
MSEAGPSSANESRRARRYSVHPPLAPPLERRRLQVSLVLLVVDAVAIVAAFSTAGFLYLGRWLDPGVMLQAQLLLPVYWTVAIGNRAYAAQAALDVRIGGLRAVVALLTAAALILFLGYFLKASQNFSRIASGLSMLFASGALLVARNLLTAPVAWRCGATALNQLVINDGGRRIDPPHTYAIDAGEHGLQPDINDPHALNRLALFLHNMDRVIVSCPPERRAAWAMILKGVNIESQIVDDEVVALGAVGARRTADYGALVIAIGPLGLRNRALKRVLDLAVAGAVLVFVAPLLLVTALAIKLEDRGPVLFIQRRLGRGNRFFPIYKFRSMRVAGLDRDGVRSTARGDDRVTRVGRVIRATSIDELPQLLNVLRGEMSLVGPRPHALASQAGDKLFWEVDGRYWQRHSLKPGLTGLAQVRGLRGATDLESDLA